ncbi:hypothetical protein [Hydrogenophaga sp. 5NK40-0174]|uniref:hypothetical protein n=1 Tax=Hydrogenophaga sp. 5NK40-0174 TaxID=3127649 RepID=UPI00333E5717
MNRCSKIDQSAFGRRTLLGASVLALACASVPAVAKSNVRNFPPKALRGTLIVQKPPVVTMDGQPTRLTPGARIFNTRNTIVLSGTLVGEKLIVNYLPDNAGKIHQVWILNEAEAALDRPRAGD